MRKSVLLAAVAATSVVAVSASMVWSAVGVDSSGLRNAVTITNTLVHLQALQAVANSNGGVRAAGTSGHSASVDYIQSQLSTGYFNITRQSFDFPLFTELSAPVLSRLTPSLVNYVEGPDFSTMTYSGSGDVSGTIKPASGIIIPPTAASSSTSGCTMADFPGTTADWTGKIALVQRGGCTFFDKATNAKAAGAAAVVIFNEGNPERTDNFGGTLGEVVTIPVLSASFAVGQQLLPAGTTVHVKTETQSTIEHTVNLIAETKLGRSDRVAVAGAHLDSVTGGPGINDNGSGSAGILEVARQMTALNIVPRNKVRFIWFSAEEAGLLGSEHYVSQLTATQIKNISVNLNFDMIASPNYVRFIYDGDGSDTPDAGPNGSAVIEDVFKKYFQSQGLRTEPTAFDGRSDYGPFIDAGIPAGGLFTGADDVKTAAEVLVYGGIALEIHDPCYHQACDDINNVINNPDYGDRGKLVFDVMLDAVADAVLQFAMTTSATKGTSKANDRAVKSVDAASLLYKGSQLQR